LLIFDFIHSIMYLLLIIIAILFVGFFAGIEVAFVSANKLSIELKKKQGKTSGILISRFLENPSRFIGVCLIGFNIFLVAYGSMVGALLQPFWEITGINRFDSSGTLQVLAELVVAAGIVLFTEFFFKAIFRAKNDTLLAASAQIMSLFYQVFAPVGRFFVSISNWMLQYLFNVPVADPKRPFSRIDLEHYFQQTKESEEDNTELNQELFENALSLSGVKIRSCLVPRKEIVGIDKKSSISEAVTKMVETKLSKLIVYDGNIDNIVGYVHQLDMFKHPAAVETVLLPIPAVPETMGVTDLINKLTKERKSIAWVVDEFGGTAGIVTMEDLLEEIFGEIRDEYDTEEFVEKQLSESEYMFSGRLETDYLHEKYGLEFEGDDSETLSGFVINHHDVFPKQGDRLIINDYQFEILHMSDTRIELLKLKVLS
jgi:putative hemolysin